MRHRTGQFVDTLSWQAIDGSAIWVSGAGLTLCVPHFELGSGGDGETLRGHERRLNTGALVALPTLRGMAAQTMASPRAQRREPDKGRR